MTIFHFKEKEMNRFEMIERLKKIHDELGEKYKKSFQEASERDFNRMIDSAKEGNSIHVMGGDGIVRVSFSTGQIVDGYWLVNRTHREYIVEPITENDLTTGD